MSAGQEMIKKMQESWKEIERRANKKLSLTKPDQSMQEEANEAASFISKAQNRYSKKYKINFQFQVATRSRTQRFLQLM